MRQESKQEKGLQAVFTGQQENKSKLQPGTKIKITTVQEVLPKGGCAHKFQSLGSLGLRPRLRTQWCPEPQAAEGSWLPPD